MLQTHPNSVLRARQGLVLSWKAYLGYVDTPLAISRPSPGRFLFFLFFSKKYILKLLWSKYGVLTPLVTKVPRGWSSKRLWVAPLRAKFSELPLITEDLYKKMLQFGRPAALKCNLTSVFFLQLCIEIPKFSRLRRYQCIKEF